MTERSVQPELLDHLAADDPAAIRSREELLLINHLMGNQRWLIQQIKDCLLPEQRVLELGAGDGSLARALIAEGVCQPAQITALDLAPAPAHWPSEATWLQRDVLGDQPWPAADIIVANLFLHHFEPPALRQIGHRLQSVCHLIRVLAVEPARRRRHCWQGALLGYLAELSPVTAHDMMVSIRAGFVGEELSEALALDGFECTASTTWLGAYRFLAVPCERLS
jgi:SAM-dependent methyltransferase